MRIQELLDSAYAMAGSMNTQGYLFAGSLEGYVVAASMAYDQAGLDPIKNRKLTPGIVQDEHAFQVYLVATAKGLLGAHHLLTNGDKTHVDEVDLFMWDGQFEASSGRLVSPDARYLRDYHVTATRLNTVTGFMLAACDAQLFEPVERQSVLSVPQ